MATIRDVIGMDPVASYTSSKVTAIPNPYPSLLFGLELEIENLPDWDDMKLIQGAMTQTEDGSLRNYGREFITSPMTYSHVDMVLRDFFSRNKINESNYSERCSIHVHTNVQDITFEQLANICMLYQVFERVLFRWIGHERDRNIFCVPWYDTSHMTYRVVNRLKSGDKWVAGEWQKYTALNLVPVTGQGTIEWRHMNGHCDINRIMQWLRFIQHMYRIATATPCEQLQNMLTMLNTTSQYQDVMNTVFQDDAKLLRQPGYEIDLEDGVLNMKFSLLNPSGKRLMTNSTVETINQMIQRVNNAQRAAPLVHEHDWPLNYFNPAATTTGTTGHNWVVMDELVTQTREIEGNI